MAAQHHDYHLVEPSPWPLAVAITLLAVTTGAVFWMHGQAWAPWVFAAGCAGLFLILYLWWADVVKEAQEQGHHTPVVQLHLRYGMILFIASEVMFFVAWFWAYFNASLFPEAYVAIKDITGGQWPPKDVETLDPFTFPLLNTLILLLSGTTVTWAHHALIHNDRSGLIKGLACTVILGMLFTAVQAYEYYHSSFPFAGSIYGATFFMATGFHGFHVICGTLFLIVCLFRAMRGHFKPDQHFGFEAAAWYWHFVDVVWLFLFVCIYVLGSDFGMAGTAH